MVSKSLGGDATSRQYGDVEGRLSLQEVPDKISKIFFGDPQQQYQQGRQFLYQESISKITFNSSIIGLYKLFSSFLIYCLILITYLVIFENTLLGSYGAPYGDSYGAPAYAPAPANPVGYSFYPNFSNGLKSKNYVTL